MSRRLPVTLKKNTMFPLASFFVAVIASTDAFATFVDQNYDWTSPTVFPELTVPDGFGPLGYEDACSSRMPHFTAVHPAKTTNGTIFTTLNENPEFSRLVKFINVSDDTVSLLNDSSVNLTFFAVPNCAIPKPRRKHHHHIPSSLTQLGLGLGELISTLEPVIDDGVYSDHAPDDRVKRLITAVLSYHIIQQGLDVAALTKNTTYPTRLSHVFGALNDESIRVRFGSGLPFARVNFYSQVIKPDIGATNGFIHVVNRPLAPPLTVFQSIFLLEQGFSTLSSAIQRTGLTNELDYKFVPDSSEAKISFEGSPVVTAFSPTNKAFSSLPRDLQLFLFSPFGERFLKKILQFHIVPEVALYTDWVLNSTSEDLLDNVGEEVVGSNEEPGSVWDSMLGDQHPLREGSSAPFPKPEIIYNLTLPTALDGHTLNVLLVKIPIRLPIPKRPKEIGHFKQLYVNGQKASVYDAVALNGAFHVVDKLVSPRRSKRGPHHGDVLGFDISGPDLGEDDDDWRNWKEWMFEWAEI